MLAMKRSLSGMDALMRDQSTSLDESLVASFKGAGKLSFIGVSLDMPLEVGSSLKLLSIRLAISI